MLTSYRAILKGDRVEWLNSEAPKLKPGSEILVDITILGQQGELATDAIRVSQIGDVLNRLAGIDAFAEIDDPATWERQIREDRELPNR